MSKITKQQSVVEALMEQLPAMTLEQLRALNDVVVFHIRERQRARTAAVIGSFRVGDVVTFVKGRCRHFVRVETVTAKNLKGLEVDPRDHKLLLKVGRTTPLGGYVEVPRRWTMNPTMVSKAGD